MSGSFRASLSALLEANCIHAIYRALHLSPLEDWDTQRDQIVKALGDYGIAKIGCNHCTGRTAVEKMLASGLPVQRGTARNGSQTDLFLGNVDVLELGLEGASNP